MEVTYQKLKERLWHQKWFRPETVKLDATYGFSTPYPDLVSQIPKRIFPR